MSLYYEAASFLVSGPGVSGSLKSKVFSTKHLKSKPTQVFALATEASKWSEILSEVIEKSQLLQQERKLSPSLGLLLVHDLLLSKKGIAAPASHPLRVAVTKHKARLTAELTKARIKRGFSSLQGLQGHIEAGISNNGHSNGDGEKGAMTPVESTRRWLHPRWVRVNALRTSVEEQVKTTFAQYKALESIEDLLAKGMMVENTKFMHIDKHVPDLLAFSPTEDLTKTAAYRNGLIILQDKASCFPAYLLGPPTKGMDCIDACAAPGNKTTHMAAIIQSMEPKRKFTIYACERDKHRAKTLQSMVTVAGANSSVRVKAGQDFLELDPTNPTWNNVSSILLDPSCSGSGIVGRDDELTVTLPRSGDVAAATSTKKRKRKTSVVPAAEISTQEKADVVVEETPTDSSTRLDALTHFQLKLLLHAFQFSNATRITYSTCSIHDQENEHVAMKALLSSVAMNRGWRILPRDQQVSGMAAWNIRGHQSACKEISQSHGGLHGAFSAGDVADACMRCEKGTKEGTQGFFVAAFARLDPTSCSSDDVLCTQQTPPDIGQTGFDEDEWGGFSDSEG